MYIIISILFPRGTLVNSKFVFQLPRYFLIDKKVEKKMRKKIFTVSSSVLYNKEENCQGKVCYD